MNISEFSIKRSVFAWMIMFSAIIFGAISLSRLGISYLPDVDFPILSIRFVWPGASANIMETEIADRVEKVIIGVEGLKEIKSEVRQGSVTINLEFDLDRNVDSALQEVQAYLSQYILPTGVDPPSILKTNPEDSPIIWMGLQGKRSIRDLFVYADSYIIDRINLVPGVGEVVIGGNPERNLRVWVNGKKLKKYELTILDVKNAIESQHLESSAGYLENRKTEIQVRALGEAPDTANFGNILINRRGNTPIYDSNIRLKDVARIEDGLNDFRRMNRINGVPGLSIGIKKQRGANAVEVGERIYQEITRINTKMPQDMKLAIIFDGVRYIRNAVWDTIYAFLYAIILTSIIVFLFLGNFQSAVNILLAIPTSIMGTFIVLYFSGFTLNLFSLLGLSLVIGIVVDDAIIVLENIFRHFEMGKSKAQAARDGAKEVFFAVLATSVVLISIFLPVAFMQGVIGRFFFQLGVTISAAVALSMVDAVTLTPMRASRFLDKERKLKIVILMDKAIISGAKLYARWLALTLRHPIKVLAFSIFLFFVSLTLWNFLRKELVPYQDQSQFGINISTPEGSSLKFTESKAREAEKIIRTFPEIKDIFAITGGFTGGASNLARIIISMTDPSERKLSQKDITALLTKKLKEVKQIRSVIFDFRSRGLTPRQSYPLEFSIRGPEWKVLKEISDKISRELEKNKAIRGLDMDYKENMPEISIIPKRDEAMARGVNIESIVNTVSTAIGGIRQGRFTSGDRRIDIRIRLESQERKEADDILDLDIRNQFAEMVNIKKVANLKTENSVQSLSRIDRARSISIFGYINEDASQAGMIHESEKIAKKYLKEGYEYFSAGEGRSLSESLASLYVALILGIVASYIVLAVQFNSFIHPLVILLAVPFSVSGAFLTLLVFGQSINLFSFIGIVLLVGLVTKNSILLVEFTNQVREKEGLDVIPALLKACPIRLRPIIMTSASTIAAAIPPALPIGVGYEARLPMSLAIIGGMVISTAFTLYVVPAFYLKVVRFEKKKKIDF